LHLLPKAGWPKWKIDNAVQSYLDLFHFGNESARGGNLIDEIIGIAFEAISTDRLAKLLNQLDAKSCRETATNLENLEKQTQTWNETIQLEKYWQSQLSPGLWSAIYRATLMRYQLNDTYRKGEAKFNTLQIKTRELLIDLAARAYALDKGHRPASLADLVPDYLTAIPQDPLTGTNLIYSPR
jgi:hypothetical protein